MEATGRASRRQRELPAQVVVYYVICLTLYMPVSYREVLRSLLEGLVWLFGPGARVTVAAKSSISAARSRLGWEPIKLLHDELVKPIAQAAAQELAAHHARRKAQDEQLPHPPFNLPTPRISPNRADT